MPSTCDSLLVPKKLDQIGSGSDGDSDILESSHEPDELEPREGGAEAEENDDIDDFMDASGASDLAMAHKQHDSLSQLNQFLILRNFTTLWIKGIRHILMSQEIMWQWHNSAGIHFACQVRFLAYHYQLFEYLPASICGEDCEWSLLNNE